MENTIGMSNNTNDYSTRTNNGTLFVGSDVTIFQTLALASALKFYAATGMKVNANYTPTNMLKTATAYTGYKYKRGEFTKAATDLTNYANELKGLPQE